MAEGLVYDLFVSYADADKAWVEGYLLDSLTSAGVSCHSKATFDLGVPLLVGFEEGIKKSQKTLLVISSAYLNNDTTRFIEILAQSYGMDKGSWLVIPLILQQGLVLPPSLSILKALPATNSAEQESAIVRLCDEFKTPPSPVQLIECPYPGMKPFEKRNSPSFFGRDKECEDIINCLRLHPFRAVIGPSGSGKSSLVFAGVLPKLESSSLFGSGSWLFRDMRPGSNPLNRLQTILESNSSDLEMVVKNLLQGQVAQRFLLIIDQFEELFTVAKNEEIESFQKYIKQLSQTQNCYVILTLRADFFGDLMTSNLWEEIRERHTLISLPGEEGLKQAIMNPAEMAGVYVEAALIERLIADTSGEPGALPLLQEALVLLWDKRERRFLPLKAYEQLAETAILTRSSYGTNPHPTGLQVAIARLADNAMACLSENQQQIARRIFLRLVQFNEGRVETRRQLPLEQIQAKDDSPEDFLKSLDTLIKNRLLTITSEEMNNVKKIDISHEALISGWGSLQEWIRKLKEAELIRRRLVDKAKEWKRLGGGGLLDKVELAEARQWLSLPEAKELGKDEILLQLVDASKKAINHLRIKFGMGGIALFLTLGGIIYTYLLSVEENSLRAKAESIRHLHSEEAKPTLEKMIKKAQEYEKREKIDDALVFYQYIYRESAWILLQSKTMQKSDTQDFKYPRVTCNVGSASQPTNNSEMSKIYRNAELSLIKLIECHRIQNPGGLQEVLQNAQKSFTLNPDSSSILFGEFNEKASNRANQYTPNSALQLTYKILFTEWGLHADIDNNGEINDDLQLESFLLNCEILKRIEEVWRKNTDNKCGWYDINGEMGVYDTTYHAKGCRQLNGLTLSRTVLSYPVNDSIDSINKCFKVKLLDYI